jgi:hypothetical protein
MRGNCSRIVFILIAILWAYVGSAAGQAASPSEPATSANLVAAAPASGKATQIPSKATIAQAPADVARRSCSAGAGEKE